MTWGSWGEQLTTAEMTARIEAIVQLGVTHFDHADIYGGYTTEAEFGAAFAQSSVSREALTYITKCGIQYPCDTRPLAVKHYNFSPQHIRFSVENSLRNLQTDYIDLLLLHRPSPLMNPAVIIPTIQSLQQEGKIKAFGVSNFTASQIELLGNEIEIAWNQIQCSLTHTDSFTNGDLDYCQVHSIGVMAWSPLGSYFKESNVLQERLQPLMQELQKSYGASEDQLLLAWLLQHPATIHPVLGTTKPERIQKALDAIDITLDIQDWFRLYEASRGHRVA